MAELVVFYCFASILVFAAFRVITVRNPVHAALFLVLAFFSSACVWLLLEAEFLAIVLVLVYVGAVMVLFLFVVMMLDINLSPLREGFTRYLGLGAAIAGADRGAASPRARVGTLWTRAGRSSRAPRRGLQQHRGARRTALYGVRVPLRDRRGRMLVAIIAAISLTMAPTPRHQGAESAEQVAVRRADRVRLVKMRPEDRQ